MSDPLTQLLSDPTHLAAHADSVFGDRKLLPSTELADHLVSLFKRKNLPVPTDLILAAAEETKPELTLDDYIAVARKVLGKAKERSKLGREDNGTPAMPVMKAARRKQKSRSQNHTPIRGMPRHLPLPSYPVSVSVFYQEGKANKVWSERTEHQCELQNERSNLAEYNLVLRRFPELQRSLRTSIDLDRPRVSSPGKEPRYRAPTERRITQQRTIVNSPGRADYQAPKAFIPANPVEAKVQLDRVVHGFQGSPYEAKRYVLSTQDDYAEYLRSKDSRVGSHFKPAYVGDHLVDRSLYINSQLNAAAFTQKSTSKRATHSQTFYP